MAQIETWLRTDLKHVVQVQELDGNLFTADNMANRIGVILTDNGAPVTITGGITAYMIRGDEATLVMTGMSEASKAWVDLPTSAYTKIGPFSIVIKNGTTTIGACTGYMYRSTTDEIVDPGHVIPSIEELLAEIENTRAAGREATAAANTANTAASNADDKAAVAQTAANTANTAATNANNKAATAQTAAQTADNAAAKIDGLVVIITQGDPTLPPSSKLELINGHYQLTITNVKGLKGDTGDAFHITKTYPSVTAMNADYGGTDTAVGDYVMVTSSVEDPDNAKVYIKGSSAWQFVVDMSGATGIKGDTGTGITGASFANDKLTLNFSDGTSYTTPSLRGKAFEIRKVYRSISAMEADYSGIDVDYEEFVIIQTEAGQADNGKLYKKGYQGWEFIVQMAGSEGPMGPGVPAGGITGQYLRKKSDIDYDGEWQSPVNNLTTTEGGLVLDARQGKVLKDELSEVNSDLQSLGIVVGNLTNILNAYVTSISTLINLFEKKMVARQFCVAGGAGGAASSLYGKTTSATGAGFKTSDSAYIVYHVTDSDGEIFSGWVNTSTLEVTYGKFATKNDVYQSFVLNASNSTTIQQGDDLDNYIVPGTYVIPSGTVLSSLSNIPPHITNDSGNAKLIVNRNTGDNASWWGQQILIRGNNVYSRIHSSTTWNRWVCIGFDSDITFNSDITWSIAQHADTYFRCNGNAMELLYVSSENVSVTNGNIIGTIDVTRYRPYKFIVASVFDYASGLPLDGSIWIGRDGTIRYYGNAVSNKKLIFHTSFAV